MLKNNFGRKYQNIVDFTLQNSNCMGERRVYKAELLVGLKL